MIGARRVGEGRAVGTEAGEGSHHAAVGTGEAIWFLGGLLTVKADGTATGGGFDLIEQTWPVGFAAPPHIHRREEESFYVLEGEVAFRCGERAFGAGRGDTVVLPRGVPHTFRVEGSAPARMLALYTPAGARGFFAAVGRPAERRELPPPAPPDVPRLLAIAPEYGIEILPPPAP